MSEFIGIGGRQCIDVHYTSFPDAVISVHCDNVKLSVHHDYIILDRVVIFHNTIPNSVYRIDVIAGYNQIEIAKKSTMDIVDNIISDGFLFEFIKEKMYGRFSVCQMKIFEDAYDMNRL